MSTADAFREQLALLTAEYRSSLPPRLAEMDACWRLIEDGKADADTFLRLRRELHTLAGSARTFGLAALSETARRAERFIEPFCTAATVPPASECRAFALLLDEVRRSTGD